MSEASAERLSKHPFPSLDPLFRVLAQPVLRGPAGRAFMVLAGIGMPIAARPWPLDEQGRAMHAWAHAAPHDPQPWMVTQRCILALLDGQRRLALSPALPWGHEGTPPDAPYPAAVSVRVGEQTVFFINVARRVRVFAADAVQAVELAPLDEAQVYAAWESDDRIWAAGMVSRPQDAEGDLTGFGQALLMRWNTRPLALDARWQGRDLWPEDASLMAGMLGVEAWLAELPGAVAGSRWLLGAPLRRSVHDLPPDVSPFWALGLPAPDDHGDLLLARIDATAASVAPALTPPLTLTRLLAGHSLVGVCRFGAGSHPHGAQVFTLAQGDDWAARPERLHVSQWDDAVAQLGAPRPLLIDGLPPHAAHSVLLDFDVLHHPAFGYAAALTWQARETDGAGAVFAPVGALLHSDDGQHWRVVQRLPADMD